MISILIKEVTHFFSSLIAYIVISVFLISIGLLTWVFPDTSILNYGFSDMSVFFSLTPYVFMFLVPAITMRIFAEENSSGTIEILLTKPISDLQIVLGKLFAGCLLVLLSIVPTVVFYVSVYMLGNPVGNIDSAGVLGSYLGLFLLACSFVSMGVFASSLTENQVVAFVIGVFFCFLFYMGFDAVAHINVWGKLSLLIEQLGILYHYNMLSKGVIDTRDVLYFFSVILLMIMLTNLTLGSRKW